MPITRAALDTLWLLFMLHSQMRLHELDPMMLQSHTLGDC